MFDKEATIADIEAQIDQISAESMQLRTRYEAILQKMNMELGEANGRMKALEELKTKIEAGEWPPQKAEA